MGPRSERISLYVLQFKVLGAEGSGFFGATPRPIETVGEIPDLLGKVALQRKRRDNAGSQGPSTRQSSPKSISVQSPNLDVSVQNDLQSQADASAFATQLPRTTVTGVPGKPAASVQAHSLGRSILTPKSPVSDKQNPLSVGNLKQFSNAELLKSFCKPRPKSPLTLVSVAPIEDTAKKPSPPPPRVEEPSRPVLDTANLSTSSAPSDDHSLPSTNRSAHPSNLPAVEKEASPQSPTRDGMPLVVPDDKGPRSPVTNTLNGQVQEKLPMMERKPPISPHRRPMKPHRRGRISMRDIRISKEQNDLLQRPDCECF